MVILEFSKHSKCLKLFDETDETEEMENIQEFWPSSRGVQTLKKRVWKLYIKLWHLDKNFKIEYTKKVYFSCGNTVKICKNMKGRIYMLCMLI